MTEPTWTGRNQRPKISNRRPVKRWRNSREGQGEEGLQTLPLEIRAVWELVKRRSSADLSQSADLPHVDILLSSYMF